MIWKGGMDGQMEDAAVFRGDSSQPDTEAGERGVWGLLYAEKVLLGLTLAAIIGGPSQSMQIEVVPLHLLQVP